MMTAFLNEYEKTLKKAGFVYTAPECSDYYAWFRNHISRAMKKRMISFEDMEERFADKLELLLRSPQAFAEFLKNEKSRFREYMENLIFEEEAQVIIFGAGHWGYEALKLLREKENCMVQAFTDNDAGKQGIAVEGVEVLGPRQALCRFPEAVILIANEKYYPKIRAQIERESEGRRILCPFE